MTEGQIMKIGVDLDGVITVHSFGGLWVRLRRLKEKMLQKVHSPTYYYPVGFLERISWKAINWLKKPMIDQSGLFSLLAKKKEVHFYLVTGRFNFLGGLTEKWLRKYHLRDFFYKTIINDKDIDPTIFKEKVIKRLRLNFFVDDDLEVLEYLGRHTQAKLYWIIPPYLEKNDNSNRQIESCRDFPEALRKIFNLP